MAVKVVDASAIAAVLFGESFGEAVATRLEGCRLIAPTLLGFEIANICVTKIRRNPERRRNLLTGFALYPSFSIELVPTDPVQILLLAETSGLTGYNASYLLLARTFSAELVTLDRQLQAAHAAPSKPV